jgi:hypothetical protein
MDKLRNAPGKNESSNRKRLGLLVSLYSTRKSHTERTVSPFGDDIRISMTMGCKERRGTYLVPTLGDNLRYSLLFL